MKTKLGFSVIEIMAALFIASVVVLFGAFEYSNYFKHREQRIFMEQLYHDLKWARMEAIALNIPVAIQSYESSSDTMTMDWCQGWVIYKNLDKQGLKKSDQILKIHTANQSECTIAFSSSLNLPYFEFFPQGTSNYQTGHFYFYEKSEVTMKIIINQLGRIRWES